MKGVKDYLARANEAEAMAAERTGAERCRWLALAGHWRQLARWAARVAAFEAPNRPDPDESGSPRGRSNFYGGSPPIHH